LLGLTGLAPAAATGEEVGTDRAIATYQRQLARRPADSWTHYRLGDAYVQKSRVTADPSWLEAAERALRQSVALTPEQARAPGPLAPWRSTRATVTPGACSATRTSRWADMLTRRRRIGGCSRRATASTPR